MNKYVVPAVVALGLILIARAMFAKGSNPATTPEGSPSQVENPSVEGIRATLREIMNHYGKAIAQNVERIYRLETTNFTSEQFLRTNTAGQVATKDTFSFGWSPRGTTPDQYAPVVVMRENIGGAVKKFVAFKSFAVAAVFLAQVMKERGNDPGKWKTLAGSPSYRAAVAAIVPVYVNSF